MDSLKENASPEAPADCDERPSSAAKDDEASPENDRKKAPQPSDTDDSTEQQQQQQQPQQPQQRATPPVECTATADNAKESSGDSEHKDDEKSANSDDSSNVKPEAEDKTAAAADQLCDDSESTPKPDKQESRGGDEMDIAEVKAEPLKEELDDQTNDSKGEEVTAGRDEDGEPHEGKKTDSVKREQPDDEGEEPPTESTDQQDAASKSKSKDESKTSIAVDGTNAAGRTATTTASGSSVAAAGINDQKPRSVEDKQFEENVKFLYRSHQREPGKRRVKPNLQLLEMDLNIPEEDSEDDSDYKVEGDEDGDNSEPGSEAAGDDDETADENSTDTDGHSDGDSENNHGESKKSKDKKSANKDNRDKENDMAKENGQPASSSSSSVFDKAKQIAEKALELNGVAAAAVKISICNICLGDRSAESDEIVECDSCGVTVHEGCYGVSDSDSILSTGSSASTEPWFCDSCKAGVLSPNCELCPNSGGIFKETDAGRWVHLVCALYTPGCAFGSVEKLTPVTLFEMQYSKWGQRACHLCEDAMMARTGVTISCDAGMCRISFHVTCAQRMGLLSDANPEYIADPFYAHCKVHVDKSRMKAKKKNWSILQHQVRLRKEKDAREEAEGQELSKEKERVLRKLNWLRDRYASNKTSKPKPWLPTQKMPRLLHSSSTAIEKFRRKAELYGLSHLLIAPPEDKRWHTQPAFSADFVAYFLDRQRRFGELEKSLEKNIDENTALRKQQALMNQLYEKVVDACKAERAHARHMTTQLNALWTPLRDLAGLRFEPRILEEKRQRETEKENGNAERISGGDERAQKQQGGGIRAGSVSPQKILKNCKVCGSSEEPHQQLECEQCRSWFHLVCLQPPLTRFPKKSKGVNWLCEDCLEANRVQAESANALMLSTSRRSRGQSSRLARETAMDTGVETGSRLARGRPTGKKRGRKPGVKNSATNKDSSKEPKVKDEPQPSATATDTPDATAPSAKDQEPNVKDKEQAAPNSELTQEKEAPPPKDKEGPAVKESDAETEDDVAVGLDEEEEEPSAEKKQPVRGRKKRKAPVGKGGAGGKRKRFSGKEKEAPKENDAPETEQERDGEMECDDSKLTADVSASKKDENNKKEEPDTEKDTTVNSTNSKRESSGGGGGSRDKQHQDNHEADDSKKKEDKKPTPAKEADKKPTPAKEADKGGDDKGVGSRNCEDKRMKEHSSVKESSSSGKGSSSKSSAAVKESSKDSKDSDAKGAVGGGRKDRESTASNSSTDGRKHCVKCDHEHTNQIVICDECGSGVHWACLSPPAKKNPKPRGYTWNCDECEAKMETAENHTANSAGGKDGKDKSRTNTAKQENEAASGPSNSEVK